MALRFCRAETIEDYFELIKAYLQRYGRPKAFYSDRHSIFRVNRKEQEAGNYRTAFHEVLKKLDIELICAHSPQAKGQVERANEVLQDRLIKELREQGISSIEEGNAYLEMFRQRYNKKFGKEPADFKNMHRCMLQSHNLDEILLEKKERIISKDLSFSYQNEIYQIESAYKHRLQGKQIEIYEKHGEIKMVLWNGEKLEYKKWRETACQPAKIVDTKELEVLWPTKKRRPERNHPWR